MKKMNKKGFTLIELLAVIVVLAIVMVIATQRITNVVNNSRANSFISSYKAIVKQINTNIVADPDNIECGKTGKQICSDVYDISNDYGLYVNEDSGKYEVVLYAKEDGKFENMDLTRYGDAAKKVTDEKGNTSYECDKSKVDSSVSPDGNCGEFITNINGDKKVKGIKGYIAE